MKIRIKGNSIRLRLTRPEVEQLEVSGSLNEATSFGSEKFVYSLQKSKTASDLYAELGRNRITVFIPAAFTRGWYLNDVIGFESRMQVSIEESLYLLVEKDFKCLDESSEDQSANFDNPGKTCP